MVIKEVNPFMRFEGVRGVRGEGLARLARRERLERMRGEFSYLIEGAHGVLAGLRNAHRL